MWTRHCPDCLYIPIAYYASVITPDISILAAVSTACGPIGRVSMDGPGFPGAAAFAGSNASSKRPSYGGSGTEEPSIPMDAADIDVAVGEVMTAWEEAEAEKAQQTLSSNFKARSTQQRGG
ncbi:uncharacterized protein BDW43DRAFT_317489 [Aspergillus alliaceus]|uniref:uncharacterized protein n=1 Tax=Petromyces alliaceus TaxID=209559 RepID=UPI0012A638F0|nr:uncharacterized protein BDW43DRAFT_317489 [Aspergillus alliaceus]KAB8226796.1 hypothetical protein BDW43DRAFT_317489 [Aspergillus alliaceus]